MKGAVFSESSEMVVDRLVVEAGREGYSEFVRLQVAVDG